MGLDKQLAEPTWKLGARIAARVGNLQRGTAEHIGQYWRRLHRLGHGWLRAMGGNLDFRHLRQLHPHAGLLVRTSTRFLCRALCDRFAAWWRFQQRRYHGKINGLHSERLNVSRWGAQIVNWHGDSEIETCNETAGSMQTAQDREAWKRPEDTFTLETCS